MSAEGGTFFAGVFRRDYELGSGSCLLNIGASAGEITDPRTVIEAVRPYAPIPADLEQRLTTAPNATRPRPA